MPKRTFQPNLRKYKNAVGFLKRLKNAPQILERRRLHNIMRNSRKRPWSIRDVLPRPYLPPYKRPGEEEEQ